jgi:hypothetical protein
MIKLNKNDVSFILSVLDLPSNLYNFLITIKEGGSINEEQADELRDYCGEKLLEIGFDEKYNTNEKGRILEDLIDKLFIGGLNNDNCKS